LTRRLSREISLQRPPAQYGSPPAQSHGHPIFITAYPERFLTGLRPEPAFLVSKPYQPTTVAALISQALFFEKNAVKSKTR
jgi:hypothetical protein